MSCGAGALVLAAVAQLARPAAEQGVLQNWAWRKAVAPPFSDPLEVAGAASAALQRLSAAAGTLGALLALTVAVCLQLLGARGTRALLPSALGSAAFVLACVLIAACFVYGTAACYASPFGCTALKAQLLAALGLGLFAPCRLAVTPATSPAASAAYAAAGLVLLLAHAACTIVCSLAAADAPRAVGGRWGRIEPLLERTGVWGRLATGCTGEASPLFEAAARLGLGSVAALSGGATLLLACILALAHHERAHEAAAQEAAEAAAAGPEQAGRTSWWWWVPSSKRERELRQALNTAPDAGGGSQPALGPGDGTLSAATTEEVLLRADAPSRTPSRAPSWVGPQLGTGSMWAEAQHTTQLTPRTTMRTTQLSNADDPAWGNAGLVLERFRGCALPRIKPLLLLGALLMLAAAWVAGTLFWDATATAAMPYTVSTHFLASVSAPAAAAAAAAFDASEERVAPRATSVADGGKAFHVVASVPYATGANCTAAVIRLHNGYARGVTTVRLVEAEGANASVTLNVDSAAPLPTPPTLDISWAGLGGEGGACGAPADDGGAAAPTLNISAFAPDGCDEQCPWRWLWASCRCHAVARLTLALPRLPGAPPLAGALGAAPAALPSVHASAAEGAVRVLGGGLGEGQLLNELSASTAAGDVTVRGVGAAGALRVGGPGGQARLSGVLAASLHVHATSAMAEAVLALQPCLCSPDGVPSGAGCAALGVDPAGPAAAAAPRFCPNRTALVMGDVTLEASGGPVVLNGTLASGTTTVATQGGSTLVVSDAQLLGTLAVVQRGGGADEGEAGGGSTHLSNVLALGCEVCMQPHLAPLLDWNASAAPELLCVCDAAPPAVQYVGAGASRLAGAAVLARSLNASASRGAISLVEMVLLPPLAPERMLEPAVAGGTDASADAKCDAAAAAPGAPPPPGYARAAPPSLVASSVLGGVTLLGLVSLQPAEAAAVQCHLSSVGGDVKATFSGGAINGSYAVVKDEPGIGHAGVVVDDAPTAALTGRLGTGNASVVVVHNYGNLALSLSSKAPSAFADVLGGAAASGAASASAAAALAAARGAPQRGAPRHYVSLHSLLRPLADAFHNKPRSNRTVVQ